jgi:hypothetical protein
MALDWSSNAYDGTNDFAGGYTSDAAMPVTMGGGAPVDWVTPLLGGVNNVVNVAGKVAMADIQANSRYPMYGYGYVPGQYQTGARASVQMSPMLLLLIVGAFVVMNK